VQSRNSKKVPEKQKIFSRFDKAVISISIFEW